jgi:hypothetical protein
MLLQPCKVLPRGNHWLYELKFDGFRGVAIKNGKDVQLWSRQRKSLTSRFPGIVEAVAALPVRSTIIDGEIVCLDLQGRPCFGDLQNFRISTRHRVWKFQPRPQLSRRKVPGFFRRNLRLRAGPASCPQRWRLRAEEGEGGDSVAGVFFGDVEAAGAAGVVGAVANPEAGDAGAAIEFGGVFGPAFFAGIAFVAGIGVGVNKLEFVDLEFERGAVKFLGGFLVLLQEFVERHPTAEAIIGELIGVVEFAGADELGIFANEADGFFDHGTNGFGSAFVIGDFVFDVLGAGES